MDVLDIQERREVRIAQRHLRCGIWDGSAGDQANGYV